MLIFAFPSWSGWMRIVMHLFRCAKWDCVWQKSGAHGGFSCRGIQDVTGALSASVIYFCTIMHRIILRWSSCIGCEGFIPRPQLLRGFLEFFLLLCASKWSLAKTDLMRSMHICEFLFWFLFHIFIKELIHVPLIENSLGPDQGQNCWRRRWKSYLPRSRSTEACRCHSWYTW